MVLASCSDTDEQGVFQYSKLPLQHPKASVVASVRPLRPV